MGDLDLFVTVQVSLSASATPTIESFGTPMLLAFLSAAAVSVNPALFRVYDSGSALTAMVADGIQTTDVAYRKMEVALAAPTAPAQVALGRRTRAMTQILALTFADTNVGTTYVATFIGYDGVSHTYSLTSTGVPATDAASYAALMTAGDLGTVTVSTTTITMTGAAGKLLDIENWSSNMQLANTTADPGVAADLAAVSAVDSIDWYGVALDSNSPAEIEAAQAYVEATDVGGKVAFYDDADYANVTGSTSDVFSILESEGYNKAYLQQSNRQVLGGGGFGLLSQLLALSPGSYTAAYKSIPGVLADTDATLTPSQSLILNTMSASAPGPGGKKGNFYRTASGLNLTWPGCAPSGRFIDNTIFIDVMQVQVQADIIALVAGLPKVPIDAIGLGLIGDTIKARMNILGKAPYGGLDPATIVVNVPAVASISPTDDANRNVPGFSATAKLTGAGQTLGVKIVLVP